MGVYLYCSHWGTSFFNVSGKKTNVLHEHIWIYNRCPQILKNKQCRAAACAACRSWAKKLLRILPACLVSLR